MIQCVVLLGDVNYFVHKLVNMDSNCIVKYVFLCLIYDCNFINAKSSITTVLIWSKSIFAKYLFGSSFIDKPSWKNVVKSRVLDYEERKGHTGFVEKEAFCIASIQDKGKNYIPKSARRKDHALWIKSWLKKTIKQFIDQVNTCPSRQRHKKYARKYKNSRSTRAEGRRSHDQYHCSPGRGCKTGHAVRRDFDPI